MDLSPPLSLPLVKLTRPRQSRVLPRPAIFEALDAAMAEHRLIWVSAPGGMGKTTLVSSYLTDRALEGTWYQIDAADSDPATLFYYLGEAVRLERGGKVALPPYNREHEPDALGFARRFFRTLFGSVAPGWTLVFDNYHEVDANSLLHRVLAVAVEEAPASVNILVTSRAAPPPPFAKAIASGVVHELGQEQLVFDADDTEALFRLHASKLDAEQAHALCRGWPAGLVLLLAGKDSATGPGLEFAPDLQYVFDYFAEEVLRRADDVTRDFLIATSFLPTITAPVAARLAGREDAAQILEKLYRQNFFVDKRPGRAPAYQYHDLFREFLVRRATESRKSAELAALKRESAQALQDAGQVEAALDLYLQSGELDRAEEIVRSEAKQLIAQGRLDTIARWLSLLPASRVGVSDDLLYLRALTGLKNDPVEARNDFERAHKGFSNRSDVAGQLLAASGVIETYFVESGNFLAAHRWLRILEQSLEPGSDLLAPEDQLRVYTSVLAACLREPSPNLGALARDRVLGLLNANVDANLRVRAGSALQTFLTQTGDFRRVEVVASSLAPALEDPAVSPVNRALWLSRYAFNLLHIQEFDRAITLLDEVTQIVTTHDLAFLDSLSRGFRIWASLFCGAFADARQRVDAWRTLVRQGPQDRTYYHACHGPMEGARGNYAKQLEHALQADRAADEGGIFYSRLSAKNRVAMAYADCGEHAKAQDCFRAVQAEFESSAPERMRQWMDATEAYISFVAGDVQRGRDALRRCIASGRAEGYLSAPPVRTNPHVFRRLVEEALRAGIEIDYVRAVIRKSNLPGMETDIEDWPWRLRVRTLGSIDVLVDDAPLASGKKAQKRSLELLAALIAKGGTAVPAADLMEAIWPDDDGDAARASFENTLHRLRKLLGAGDLLLLADGKLSLNRDFCWVDVWAFDRLTGPKCGESETHLAHALELYRAHFLVGEGDKPWMIAPRERYRARFVKTVQTLGALHECRSEYDRALRLYEHSLEVDPLSEPLFQGLIRCLERQGRRGEAMQAYRRCQTVLNKMLGVAPSPETEALGRALQAR